LFGAQLRENSEWNENNKPGFYMIMTRIFCEDYIDVYNTDGKGPGEIVETIYVLAKKGKSALREKRDFVHPKNPKK